MNRKKFLGLTSWCVLGLAMVLSYQNCSDPDYGAKGSGSVVVSRALCEGEMLEAFRASYYPFLKDACKNCHIPGGVGKGTFAHQTDIASAFASFKNATTMKIENNAQSSGHASPFTGSQNTPQIQAASKIWKEAQEICGSDVGGNFDPQGLTTSKAIAATANYRTITWNLDTEMSKGGGDLGQAAFSIQVKQVTSAGMPPVYYFDNLTVSTGTEKIQIGEIRIKINGQLVQTNSTYSRLSVEVDKARTGVVISNATAILDVPVGASDTVEIGFGKLEKVAAP
jgi:hypothetical protein